MIQIGLEISLEDEVENPIGVDFVFNVHAAATAHQSMENERLTCWRDNVVVERLVALSQV
jgi:hypothetical protein